MESLIELNSNIVATEETLKENKESLQTLLKDAIKGIAILIKDKQSKGLSYKASRREVKKEVTNLFEDKKDISKKVIRAYNIAFTAIFRDIKISQLIDELSVSQLEQLLHYFTKNEAEQVINSVDKVATFREILKEYKVETVSTKLDTTKKKVTAK